MTYDRTDLMSIARECARVIARARKALGPELAGHSMLDLVADNLPDVPLKTLQDALACLGESSPR